MDKKSTVISNLFWKFAERIGAQGVSLIVSIVLARFLMPDAYGAVSILLVFINIANVFVSEGFSTSLIQKKDSDETDFSTMFYCSLAISIILYAILFVTAPIISSFYDMPELTTLLRVLALKLPIASVNSIQHAYVSKNMLFKKFFFSTLFGTLLSGVIGVALAFSGAGAWALVAQYLINSFVDTCVLFFTVKWKPRIIFSWNRAKSLLSYGIGITAGSLLNTIYSESRSLIIGKKYSSADLAYYNKGCQFPKLIVTNVDSSIGSVLFPALSNYGTNTEELKRMVRRSMMISCYVIFPCMAGLAAVAEPLVRLLLTEKWMSAVFFLRVACITQALQPVNTANIQLIKAMGKSDLFVKMEAIKKISGIIILLCTMWFGVKTLAIGEIVVVLICNIVNARPNKKLINYGYLEQIRDILPSAILSIMMFILTWGFSQIVELPDILMIICQVLIGVGAYLLGSILFRFDEFGYLYDYVKKFIKAHK